jgi:hypothetical protein
MSYCSCYACQLPGVSFSGTSWLMYSMWLRSQPIYLGGCAFAFANSTIRVDYVAGGEERFHGGAN